VGEQLLPELSLDRREGGFDVASLVIGSIKLVPPELELVVLPVPQGGSVGQSPRVDLERDERVDPELVRE
jgi:hypothetical protein